MHPSAAADNDYTVTARGGFLCKVATRHRIVNLRPGHAQRRSSLLLIRWSTIFMAPITVGHVDEQLITSSVLMAAAARMSKMLDIFAVWLLAGLAAFLSFLLAHQAMAAATVRQSGCIFVVVAFVTIIQKYLAITIAAVVEASKIGRQAIEDHLTRRRAHGGSWELDPVIIANYIRAALLFPIQRWLVFSIMDKALRGDLVAGPKAIFKLSQIQGCIVGIDVLLTLWTVGVIVWAVK